MLNPFPDLLMFSFFAPMLLRIAAAFFFFYAARAHFARRAQIANIHLPLIGQASWAVWLLVLAEILIGLGLFAGYYTQFVVLAGMVGALKYFFYTGRFASLAVFSRGTCVLLFIVLLSLLVTGAGALAFDIPL